MIKKLTSSSPQNTSITKSPLLVAVCAIGVFAPYSASAAVLNYTETFTGTTLENYNAAATASYEFGNGSTAVTTGGFSAVTNNTVFDNTGTGTFQFTGSGNYRALGTFVSLNGIDAGTYTLNFTLSTFDTGAPSGIGAVFLASGITTAAGGGAIMTVSNGGFTTSTVIAPTASGAGSSITQLGSNIALSAVGANTGSFTLSSAGGANDYLYIGAARTGSATAGGFTIDTISIAPVPEPSSIALLGLGFLGLVARRHRN